MFEKRSPTTIIMVGFDKKCRAPYIRNTWLSGLKPDEVGYEEKYDSSLVDTYNMDLATNKRKDQLFVDCINHHYNINTVTDTVENNGKVNIITAAQADDPDLICTVATQKKVMSCLFTHANCEHYMNTDHVDPADWKVWESTCGEGLQDSNKTCDPRQFKQKCYEDQWRAWDFNTGPIDADYNKDGIVTPEENKAFHLDNAHNTLTKAMDEVFNQNASQSYSNEHTGENLPSEMVDLLKPKTAIELRNQEHNELDNANTSDSQEMTDLENYHGIE